MLPSKSRTARHVQTQKQSVPTGSFQLQKGSYEVLQQYKSNTYFFLYYKKLCEERFRTDSQGNWHSCLRYLEAYCDESTSFNDVTPDWSEVSETSSTMPRRTATRKSTTKTASTFSWDFPSIQSIPTSTSSRHASTKPSMSASLPLPPSVV